MISVSYDLLPLPPMIRLALIAMASASGAMTNSSSGMKWSLPKRAIDDEQRVHGPGSDPDFLSILNPNKGIIHKVCRVYCKNREDKKDLYHDIVLALWHAFPSFRKESKPSTWVYTIAFRNAGLYSRNSKRINIESTEAIEEFADTDENENARKKADEVMQRLDGVHRAIAMLIMEDCSRKEIGEILELSENAVNLRMMRIRERFRKEELGDRS